MSFLLRYYDPDMLIKEGETQDSIRKEEIARLTKMHALATSAGRIPRRMSIDATDDELSVDKKRCNRIAHVAAQSLVAWGEKIPIIKDNGVGQEAAQINWDTWAAEQEVWLQNRLRYIATWACKGVGQEDWGKKSLVKLLNELNWLQYAMR